MEFLINKSPPLAGEAIVSEISRVATEGVTAYAQAAKRTFELLWSDPASIQDKLDRMGNMAALAFAQHYDTVTHLLRSFARSFFAESGVVEKDLEILLTDPINWILSNHENPLSIKILERMPLSSFVPPAQYSINMDGTVTIK
jgi:hypothetical protein